MKEPERRIVTVRSKKELLEQRETDPYYLHRKEQEKLKLKAIGLPQKEIEERIDLIMQLEMRNDKYKTGSVGK
ncbi:hypothetical protein [Planococcus dechangensis]|uniref:Uncharacterized protein n=1 Tax=Planococcus dechangensis TaxID=1176255 RepID=A0ABV9MDX6_9BACL